MIKDIEQKISELNKEVGRLQGQVQITENSLTSNKSKLENLKLDKEKYQQAIEVLNFVQLQTTEKTKETFESIVTYALKYIYSDEYEFKLDFDRRGNLGTMNFNIKSPEFQELADPNDTSGGGVLDICALALRMVLLEVSHPKIEGPIILDESLKHLSKDYLKKASDFLYEISKKLDRQIIMITHQDEFINNAEYAIEVK